MLHFCDYCRSVSYLYASDWWCNSKIQRSKVKVTDINDNVTNILLLEEEEED